MYEEVSTTELLGAYLNGDVTPAERGAVEKFLDGDAAGRAQLEELRELSVLLKSGDRQARSEALAKLRDNVMAIVKQRQLQAALAAGVAEEQSSQERALVDEHIKSNPNARREIENLVAFNTRLKSSGDRVASDDLAAKLRQRVNAALPQAGLAKKDSLVNGAAAVGAERVVQGNFAPRNAAAPKNGEQAAPGRIQRPSLRVFAQRDVVWRKRVMVVGGVAALLAVCAGLAALARNYRDPQNTFVIHEDGLHPKDDKNPSDSEPSSEIPKSPAPIVKNDDAPPERPQTPPLPEPKVVGPTIPETPSVPQNPNSIKPPKNELAGPEKPNVGPAPVAPRNDFAPKVPAPTPDVVTNDNTAPRETNPKAPKAPNNNSAGNDQVAITTFPNVGPGVQSSNVPNVKTPNGGVPIPQSPSLPQTPSVAIPSHPTPTAPVNPAVTPTPETPAVAEVVKPQKPPKDPTPPKKPPAIIDTAVTPVIGNGTATVTKIGSTGQAQMTVNGIKQTLKKDDVIPSGAMIETSDGMVLALTIDSVRLYVNSNSALTVDLGNNVTVTLNSGEIYYTATGKGGLNVKAGKIDVDNATEADVSNSGKVTAANLGTKLKVTANGARKTTDNVPVGKQGVVSADASDTIKEEAVPAQPGYWRAGVLLDGDGLKAFNNSSARSRR